MKQNNANLFIQNSIAPDNNTWDLNVILQFCHLRTLPTLLTECNKPYVSLLKPQQHASASKSLMFNLLDFFTKSIIVL